MDIRLDQVEKGWENTKHRHAYFEFICCMYGSLEQRVDNEIYTLRQGDALLLPAGSNHHTYAQAPTQYLVFHFEIEMRDIYTLLQSVQQTMIPAEQTFDHGQTALEWAEDFIKAFNIKSQKKTPGLQQEDYFSEMDSAVTVLRLHARLIEFISSLAHYFLTNEALHESNDSATQGEVARQVAVLLENRLYKKTKVQDIAAELNFHRSYLSHCFKQTYGISPSEYLMRLRIREASRLLTETDTSIDEIASQLNFSSTAHFSRSFKTIAGLKPTSYRKQQRVYFKDVKRN